MNAATEIERLDILKSLTQVGASKPIGYLPLPTIRKFLSIKVSEVAQSFERQGRKARAFSADECCINGGALYVYDAVALEKLLSDKAMLLASAQWPRTPDAFVARVAKEWLEDNDPLMPLIRLAFGGGRE